MTRLRCLPAGPVFCGLAQGRRVVLVVSPAREPPRRRRRWRGLVALGVSLVISGCGMGGWL